MSVSALVNLDCPRHPGRDAFGLKRPGGQGLRPYNPVTVSPSSGASVQLQVSRKPGVHLGYAILEQRQVSVFVQQPGLCARNVRG